MCHSWYQSGSSSKTKSALAHCPPCFLQLLLNSRHGRDATLTPVSCSSSSSRGISWNFQVAMPVLVQKLLELLSSLSNFSYFTQDLCFNKWLKVGGRQTLTESFSSNKKQELMYVTNYKGHLLDSRSIHFFVAKNFVLQCNILEFQLVCSFHIQ